MANPRALSPRRALYTARLLIDRVNPPHASIAYAGRKDGIGAQIHSILSLAAYARLRGLHFVEPSLRNVAHNDAGLPDWDERWNRFFGLPLEQPSFDEDPITLRQVTRKLNLKQNGFYAATKAHRFVDYFPSIYGEIMPEYRARYDASDFQKQSLFTGDGKDLRVAIHLRRGDVITERPGRVSSIKKAASKLEALRGVLRDSGRPHEILVFSQGDPSEFSSLEGPRTKLQLNVDLFSTLHSMIEADILFTAQSALSYMAALYSTGTIVYAHHFHPRLPAWLNRVDELPKVLRASG